MNIENTSNRNPLIHLIGSMVEGTGGYIEGMEAAGQAQIVYSNKIPAEGYQDADLEALGFRLGPPVEGDEMFRTCDLPDGWYREGTEHSMHSVIRDADGYGRIGIFYKAAFYDRRADCHIVRVPRTKQQEEAYEGTYPGHEKWSHGRDRREGPNYVYVYEGRYGEDTNPPEGKHSYDHDGRWLEIEVAPDGTIVDRREFETEPQEREW